MKSNPLRPAIALLGGNRQFKAFLALAALAVATLAAGCATQGAPESWRETQGLFLDGKYEECLHALDQARAAKPLPPKEEADMLLLHGVCEERLGRQAEADRDYSELVSKSPSLPQGREAVFRLQRQAGDQKGWIEPAFLGTRWIQFKSFRDGTQVSGSYVARRAKVRVLIPNSSPLMMGRGDLFGATRSRNEDDTGTAELINTYATDNAGRDLETWGPQIEKIVAGKCPDLQWTPVQASETEIVELFQSGDCEGDRRTGVLRMFVQGSRFCYLVYYVRGREWTKLLQKSCVNLVSAARFIDPIPKAP